MLADRGILGSLPHCTAPLYAEFRLCTADEGSDSPSDAMFEHLCATLLQQSHLCPVPLEAQPVFWNYDHALHLYPIPDVLVLADRAPCASFGFPAMPADQIDQSCICLNPVTTLLLFG